MRKTRRAPVQRPPLPLLLALTVVLASGALPHARQAAAAPNPSAEPNAPPPLAWPAESPIVDSEPVGYLPGGGGVSAAGDYQYRLPIDVPDGRAGMAPAVALSYSSRSPNGALGNGWSLDWGGSEIARCGRTMAQDGINDSVHYDGTDNVCLDGQRLVLVAGTHLADGSEYRTEKDSFARIVARGDHAGGPDRFEVFARDGTIRTFVALQAERVQAAIPANAHEVLSASALHSGNVKVVWVLTETRDRSGNAILYHHDVTSEAAFPYGFEHHIGSIEYTARTDDSGEVEEPGLREVAFVYEDRPDPQFSYTGGVRHALTKRLAWIKTYAPTPKSFTVVASYRMHYGQSPSTGRSELLTVGRYDAELKGQWSRTFEWEHAARPAFTVRDLPQLATTFHKHLKPSLFDADNDGRDELAFNGQLCRTTSPDGPLFDQCVAIPGVGADRPADVNGDGKADLRAVVDGQPVFVTWNGDSQSFESTGIPAPAGRYDLVDADGDGRIDLFEVGPSAHVDSDWFEQEWFFRRNNGAGFDPPVAPAMPVAAMVEGGHAEGFDINGDGRGELHVGFSALDDPADEGDTPAGQAQWDYYAMGVTAAGTVVRRAAWAQGPPEQWTQVDLNGDGLKDKLRAAGTASLVRYNTGTGYLPAETLPTSLYPYLDKREFQVVDLDGDGREDLISAKEAAAGDVTEKAPSTYLHLRTNDGFERIDLGAAPYGIPGYNVEGPAGPASLQYQSPVLRPADVNGDGLVDLVVLLRNQAENVTRLRVLVQDWAPNDVIGRVRDEGAKGPRETVFYRPVPTDAPSAPACSYPARCMRHGMLTAREHWLHRQDEPGAIRRTAHDFDDPRVDLRGRGFLGFGRVRSVDLDSFAETITFFDHATFADNRYPYAGLPRDVWQVTPILEAPVEPSGSVMLPPGGAPVTARVTHTRHGYAVHPTNGGKTYFVENASHRVDVSEEHVSFTGGAGGAGAATGGLVLAHGGSATVPRVREGTETFDDFGNATGSVAWTHGGQRCVTSTTFDNLTAEWLLGLPLSSDVACNRDGLPLPEPRRTRFEHDSRGRVKKVTVEPDHPELSQATEYKRDSFGLVIQVTVSAAGETSRKTFLAYDDEHVYPRATWNELGHVQQQLVHPAYGVPIVGRDANGVQVHYRYDGFGRVRAIDPDDGPERLISYAASVAAGDPMGLSGAPRGLLITETREDGGEAVTRTDERGRTLETAHRGFNGEWIHQAVTYNRFGQSTEVTRPGVSAPSPDKTVTTFDTLGRPLRTVEPNGAITTLVHSTFETVTTDPERRKSRIVRDADDRVIESADFYRGQWTGMTYLYGPFSQVEDVVDPQGHAVHAAYDKLGRRTFLDDPDRGPTQWTYNGFGEVRSQTDVLGDTTVFERDPLGRVVWTSHDDDGITTFSYDGHGAPGEIGRLTGTANPDGIVTAHKHDAMGRTTSTTWQVGGSSREIGRSYDAFGRLDQLTYPHVPGHQPFVVARSYNARGLLDKLMDASDPLAPKPLWQVAARTADGQLQESLSGNGFEETRAYDPATGRLEAIEAVKDGSALFAVHYGHDLTGNVTSRTDYATGDPRTETFQYDGLDRLTRWSVQHGGAERFHKYRYDLLGNLKSVESDAGMEETHAHDGVLVNGGVTMTMPHAVTSRTVGGQTASYSYDARGRQIAGGGREILWRPFDLPKEIHQGGVVTRFAYDAFGTRVRKQRLSGAGSVTEETLTLGGLYERRWSAAAPNKAEHVYYVHGTEGPVAQVVYEESANAAGEKEKTLYLQQEALGSVGLVTDGAGNEVERTYFEPFGGKVDAAGKAASPLLDQVKLGFTGHRHDDDLALVNMVGRIYDPSQKRFLTPDPFITQPLSGQSYNRYSYVVNNPLRYTDPSGYQQKAWEGSLASVTVKGDGDRGVMVVPGATIIGARPNVAVSTEGQTSPPTGAVTPPSPPDPKQQASDDAARGDDLTRRYGEASSIGDRRDDVAFKAHGSQRAPRVAYEDPVADFAKDAAESGGTVVATYLFGEGGAVLVLGAVSGGGQMLGGILSGNSDDVREGAKGVLVAVAAEVTLTVVSEALAEIEAGGGGDAGSGGDGTNKLPDDRLSAPPDKRGNAPIGTDGHPVELHHRGQQPGSPLDEMTRSDHRGKDNFSKNHHNTGQEASTIDRHKWKKQQKEYWKKEWDDGRFKK